MSTVMIGGSNTGAIAQGDHAQAICAGGAETELKAGDTVRLRSGGPLMTVVLIVGDAVRCAWFQGKENREGSFPAAALDREDPAWRGDKRGM